MASAMHADPKSDTNLNIDIDADSESLFGSPPPSPGCRGRSPSPLALPSAAGSAQNVGTLALPGLHLVAEPSVHPPASLPLSDRPTNIAQPSRPQPVQLPYARPPLLSPALTRSPSVEAGRSAPVPRKTRKGKEKATLCSRTSTPRPAPPPIQIPSPDEPLPPNFLRNQQALLGLAGLVGGVNPKQLSMQRGSSVRNPIVVDDDPSTGQGPLTSQPLSISRNPLSAPVDPGHLPSPSGEEILASLVRSGNIMPVVQSLMRLLSGPAPSAPPPPQLPARTGWERPEPSAAPPLKRRKLNKVPAGATDWDVPYPFQDGQGPQDYHTTWAHDRARALLADFVGLVQGAAKKAAVKGYYQQQERERKRKWMEEREGVVRRYYRARTATYGMDPGQVAASGGQVPVSGASTSGTGSPAQSVAPVVRQTMSEPPLQSSRSSQAELLSSSVDEIVASLLAASNVQQQQQASTSTASTSIIDGSSQVSSPTPGLSETDGAQPYFDDWLSLLNAFPPGDPNETGLPATFDDTLNEFASLIGASATDASALNNSADFIATSSASSNAHACAHEPSFTSSFSSSSTHTQSAYISSQTASQTRISDCPEAAEPIPDFLIDPALFELPMLPDTVQSQPPPSSSTVQASSGTTSDVGILQASGSASGLGLSLSNNAMHLTTTIPGVPPTPPLTNADSGSGVGSPIASTISLADQDRGPTTPEWLWAFGEPGVACGEGAGASFEALMSEIGIEGHKGAGAEIGVEAVKEFERALEKAKARMPEEYEMQVDIPVQAPEMVQTCAAESLQSPMQVDEALPPVMEPNASPFDSSDGRNSPFRVTAAPLSQLPYEHPDGLEIHPQTQGPTASTSSLPSLSLPLEDHAQAQASVHASASANPQSEHTPYAPSTMSNRDEGQSSSSAVHPATHEPSGLPIQPQLLSQPQPVAAPRWPNHAHFSPGPSSSTASVSPIAGPSTTASTGGPSNQILVPAALSPTSPITTPLPPPVPYTLSTLLSLASSSPSSSRAPLSALPPAALKGFNPAQAAAQKAQTKNARARVLERARALKGELEKARERARVELWECVVEMGGLVAVGKEVEGKAKGGAGAGGVSGRRM